MVKINQSTLTVYLIVLLSVLLILSTRTATLENVFAKYYNLHRTTVEADLSSSFLRHYDEDRAHQLENYDNYQNGIVSDEGNDNSSASRSIMPALVGHDGSGGSGQRWFRSGGSGAVVQAAVVQASGGSGAVVQRWFRQRWSSGSGGSGSGGHDGSGGSGSGGHDGSGGSGSGGHDGSGGSGSGGHDGSGGSGSGGSWQRWFRERWS